MASVNRKESNDLYECKLSIDDMTKAEKELNEHPSSRLVEIKELRRRVELIPCLYPRLDLPFLLAFLRARKFNQERTYQLIKNYYQTKKDRADFFDDLKPSRMKHIISDKIIEVLKNRNNNGCKVIILRISRWNPDKYGMIEIPKLLFLVLMKLVEEEETQIHGVHIINNLKSVTWKHGRHVGPVMAKFFLGVIQDMVPLRLKRLDYVNEPTFFDIVFPIIRQFMKDKLVKRIHMNGEDLEGIHAVMKPEYLPEDLGGTLPIYANGQEFMKELLQSDKEFEDDNKFGYVQMALEKAKRENAKQDAGLSGLGGTFKKLEL